MNNKDNTGNEAAGMDIHGILKHLPHRYPFLLIDRVIDYAVGDYLIAIKNVTFNEPFFTGHFPVQPVMPGVLLLEAMAQATGVLAFRTTNSQPEDGSLYLLVGIDKARFKRPVEPGDQVRIEVKYVRNMRNIWFFSAEARVDGELAASADIMCASKEVTA
ncbi:MAG: 3-hydroxyacyl-ACP dehydratase FabZ [Gammaproteobacteria bacterium]|nr:3-hydroxyacyl-ACP dehydratase FabZ [Gammaproteobacteria bacterium]